MRVFVWEVRSGCYRLPYVCVYVSGGVIFVLYSLACVLGGRWGGGNHVCVANQVVTRAVSSCEISRLHNMGRSVFSLLLWRTPVLAPKALNGPPFSFPDASSQGNSLQSLVLFRGGQVMCMLKWYSCLSRTPSSVGCRVCFGGDWGVWVDRNTG